MIPATFTESKQHYTFDKYFYIKNGDEEKEFANNISINMGKNKYALNEHMLFRQAVLRQLAIQIGNRNAEVGGS